MNVIWLNQNFPNFLMSSLTMMSPEIHYHTKVSRVKLHDKSRRSSPQHAHCSFEPPYITEPRSFKLWQTATLPLHSTCLIFWTSEPPLDSITHDDTEKRVGEEELVAFQLHDELDERRDRNDGKLESEFNMNLYGTRSLTLRFSYQPYVDLRTMETISSRNWGIPLWFAYDMYNAFGYLVRGSPCPSFRYQNTHTQ